MKKQIKIKIYNMYNKQRTSDMLITADYFRLDEILKKMVGANAITNEEREELLHKSGLIKQEDGRWKETPTDPRSGIYPAYLTLDWNFDYCTTIRNWKNIKVISSIKHLLNNFKYYGRFWHF